MSKTHTIEISNELLEKLEPLMAMTAHCKAMKAEKVPNLPTFTEWNFRLRRDADELFDRAMRFIAAEHLCAKGVAPAIYRRVRG